MKSNVYEIEFVCSEYIYLGNAMSLIRPVWQVDNRNESNVSISI